MVGPSPVTSNGTETTEIEDDEVVEMEPVPQEKSRGSGTVRPHISLTTVI